MLRSFALVMAVFVSASNAMAGALLEAVKVGDVSKAQAALLNGADANEKTGFLPREGSSSPRRGRLVRPAGLVRLSLARPFISAV